MTMHGLWYCGILLMSCWFVGNLKIEAMTAYECLCILGNEIRYWKCENNKKHPNINVSCAKISKGQNLRVRTRELCTSHERLQ